MTQTPHLSFLRERVREIRSALFFNYGRSPLLYPAGIVSALDLNEDGYILFFITCPDVLLAEDKLFPARLDFYRKGKPFFLIVNGMAEIITDGDKAHKYYSTYSDGIPQTGRKLALVQLKIDQVDYHEHRESGKDNVLDRVGLNLLSWLLGRRTEQPSLLSMKIV